MSNGLAFAPAVRHEAKARVAIIGPTGAGKTWTALEWATTLGDRVAVIDTENGSASLYSDQFTFDTAAWWPPYDATKLAAAVTHAAGAYDVVVIDSLSHFWQGEGGVLDVVEAAAERARGNNARSNSFAGWKTGSPVWRNLLDTLIFAPCHVIVTMRSKMDYVQTQVDGRTRIEKVGLAPVARNDVEFEFTVVGDMDQGHKMTITKSRCAPLADQTALANNTRKLAVVLKEWLSTAEPGQTGPPPAQPTDDVETTDDAPTKKMTAKAMAAFGQAGITDRDDRLKFTAAVIGRDIDSWNHCTKSEGVKVIDTIEKVNRGELVAAVQLDGTFDIRQKEEAVA